MTTTPDPVLPGEGPVSDEQSPMSDADQLRAENVRLLRKLELANKYRQHSIEVRRELERKLVSWREAAEEALSECAALTAKAGKLAGFADSVRRAQPRSEHGDLDAGWNACLESIQDGLTIDVLAALGPASGMPRPPAVEAPREYRCPWCTSTRWISVTVEGRAMAQCVLCEAIHTELVPTPAPESHCLAAQEPVSGPETARTGSDRGTGITEAQASDG